MPLSANPRFLLAAALAVLSSVASGETLKLKEGTVLQGTLLSRSDSLLVFRSETLGELNIPIAAVAEMHRPSPMDLRQGGTVLDGSPARTGAEAGPAGVSPRLDTADADGEPNRPGAGKAVGIDPADQALFFMPTAFTPARGSFMFRDFELLFLTFGYAPTGSTTVTAGFLFPISPDFQVLTAGFKQQLYRSGDERFAMAATGNFTKPMGDFGEEFGAVANGNLVASYRRPDPVSGIPDLVGIHAALGCLGIQEKYEDYDATAGGWRTHDEWGANFTLAAAAEVRFSRHAKLMVEYLSSAPFDEDGEIDGGLLTLGLRLHGARLSADIAGLRPLGADDGDFIFLPLLTVSYRI